MTKHTETPTRNFPPLDPVTKHRTETAEHTLSSETKVKRNSGATERVLGQGSRSKVTGSLGNGLMKRSLIKEAD